MFCRNCGTQLEQDAKFCKDCGTPVDVNAKAGNHPGSNAFDHLKHQLNHTEDATASFDPADIQANKILAALSYILFFLPLLACPDSKFGRFHSNQALLLAIACFGWSVAGWVINWIPILGWLVSGAGYLVLIAFAIMAMVQTLDGRAKRLPFIGTLDLIK